MGTMKFEVAGFEELMQSLAQVQMKLTEIDSRDQSGFWLTDELVMARLSIGKTTLRDWREHYGLPFRQLGEVRRYKADEVDAWFSEFRPGSASAMKMVNAGLAKKMAKVS